MTSRQKKKITHRAGVIPYYIDENDQVLMLFMQPSDAEYGGKEFQIAKGKHDEGESAHTAAFREAHEELGLKKENVGLIYQLGVFLGYTTIFLAHVLSTDDFDEPHFETGDTKWMTAEEFAKVGRSLHKPIVREAIKFIKTEENL
jgi:8-oxo-dGTP pyrophosphatase MutT (NUDIX family)